VVAWFCNWYFSDSQIKALSEKYNGKRDANLIKAIEDDVNCSIYESTPLNEVLEIEGLEKKSYEI
jgi:hypothetical protein